MKVIESTNIDLIEPFPATEAKRAFGWIHCYKNIVESDLSPKTPEGFEAYLTHLLPLCRSFGVIDKANICKMKHEAPLVGLVVFEPSTVWNCYLYLASPRRAWTKGLIDEAIRTAIGEVFSSEPTITRISLYAPETNGPVKGLARRLGFRYEGSMEDMVTQNGDPRSLLHFGVTRRKWMAPPPAELAAAEG